MSTLKPVYSLYKQILKALDNKVRDDHRCNILTKSDFLKITRGNCAPQFKKTAFGQSAFSVRVVWKWNSIPKKR